MTIVFIEQVCRFCVYMYVITFSIKYSVRLFKFVWICNPQHILEMYICIQRPELSLLTNL